jgi:hypothetical protein
MPFARMEKAPLTRGECRVRVAVKLPVKLRTLAVARMVPFTEFSPATSTFDFGSNRLEIIQEPNAERCGDI